jgi:hypothetical protein
MIKFANLQTIQRPRLSIVEHIRKGGGASALMVALVATSLATTAFADTGSSATQSIGASEVRGLNGSGVRGLNGSGVRGLNGSGVRVSAQFESVAMGPVESISPTAEGSETLSIRVIGQTYTTSAEMIGTIALGDYVVAAGNLEGELQVVYDVGSQYVPGSSAVLVRGVVSEITPALASLTIGTVQVEYSAYTTSDPNYVPVVGIPVEVVGTQPLEGSQIVLDVDHAALVMVTQLGGESD